MLNIKKIPYFFSLLLLLLTSCNNSPKAHESTALSSQQVKAVQFCTELYEPKPKLKPGEIRVVKTTDKEELILYLCGNVLAADQNAKIDSESLKQLQELRE